MFEIVDDVQNIFATLDQYDDYQTTKISETIAIITYSLYYLNITTTTMLCHMSDRKEGHRESKRRKSRN